MSESGLFPIMGALLPGGIYMGFFEIWGQMGWLAKGVVILIVIVAAYFISVMAERVVSDRAKSKQSQGDKEDK